MDQKLTMVRGDTASFGLEIQGLDQDLSSAYLTVRDGFEGQILLQKSLNDGISKIETGQYVIRIAPEDTENAQAGEYYYDFEIGANGDIFTVLRGILVIEHDVTY